MKAIRILSSVLLASVLIVCSCSKKSEVTTTKMEQSFSTAEPSAKSEADQAVKAIKAGDYQGAVASLQKLASNAKLTPEQKEAVKDMITQVQEKITAGMKDAAKSTEKAMDDLKKSVPK